MRTDVWRLFVLLGLSVWLVRADVASVSSAEPDDGAPALSARPRVSGGKAVEVIPEEASRHAVLVGVNDYEECNDLAYCKADVTALAEHLVKIGFDRRDIVVLADGEKIGPSRRNIVEQLDATLKVAGERDLVVVALSGHGARIEGRSYFCPRDARPDDPAGTMIPIDELYRKLEACPARLKLVFIDACRNNFLPVEARPLAEQGKSIDAFARSLSDAHVPKGVVLLASCTSGERSWEDKDFGHGVFMHYILEGLAGSADRTQASGNQDGWVSLFELCDYVRLETKLHVLRTRRKAQRPYYHTSLDLPDFQLTRAIHPWTIYTAWPFDAAEARRRQEETAKAIGQPVELTNSIGMKFRLIPAGEFMMGSPEDEDQHYRDEGPVHRVRITNSYYLGAYEVTVSQFREFVQATGYKTDAEKDGKGGFGYDADAREDWWSQKPEYTWRTPGLSQNDDHPVVTVSWNDAVAFCEWLSRKEGRSYRLPTEAQWEYACRAGTTTPFDFGGVLNGKQANCSGDFPYPQFGGGFDGVWKKETTPVGSYRPNRWGLYDMHGNVFEWCADWYGEKYYSESVVDDPKGPTSGLGCVVRGGGWFLGACVCRSAARSQFFPKGHAMSEVGFRLCLVPVE